MIPIYEADRLEDLPLFDRSPQAEEDVGAAVDAILADVRTRGDEALREYTRRFNGVALTSFEVAKAEMEAAWEAVDGNFRETLRQAADNIRHFHEAQVHRDFCLTDRPGVVLGQRYTPVERVGICVPGSPVAFPSTILMNVIPARIAGVKEIAVVTPPPGSRTLQSGRASTATPGLPCPARKRKESDPMSRWISQEAERLAPYTPGEQPQDQQYVKLNTNESPFPPSPKVLKAINRAEILKLNLYSDPTCAALTEAIARRYELKAKNVLAGNGSDEVLAFAFRAFCGAGQPVAFADVTYGFYKSQAALFDLDVKIIPLREDFTLHVDDYMDFPGTIVIANPNAPTGIAVPRNDIQRLLEANPDRVVIVDEAYVDFGAESCVPMIYRYDNLLVTQTMSKSRSLAGGRVGYALGSPELIADLNRVKYSFHPYNVNRLSIAAGAAAVADEAYFAACTAAIRQTRAWTVGELENLGFTVLPSQANFVFVRHSQLPGETLYRKLKENGVLVRWFDADRIRDYIRITIGSMEQMETLVEELTAILEEL